MRTLSGLASRRSVKVAGAWKQAAWHQRSTMNSAGRDWRSRGGDVDGVVLGFIFCLQPLLPAT